MSEVTHVNFMDVTKCIGVSVHGNFTASYGKIKVLNEILPSCLTVTDAPTMDYDEAQMMRL